MNPKLCVCLPTYFLPSGVFHCTTKTASWRCLWGRNQNLDVPWSLYSSQLRHGTVDSTEVRSSGKEHTVKKEKEESLARSGGCHPKAVSLNQSLLGIYYGILLILKITTELMTTFVGRV